MLDRDAYVKKIQAKLDEWNADIDALEARVQTAQADVHLVLNRRLDALRAQRDDVAAKLQALRNASGEAWQDLTAGMELAWESLSEALQSAWSHFR
ncbi:MAG: hypothetical protein R3C12_10095 [Planctomycetaceae bacterium]|nr:hypothetical protein [Planctomycetaceae bacterium]